MRRMILPVSLFTLLVSLALLIVSVNASEPEQQPRSSQELVEQVKQLIDALDASELQVRSAARHALIELGPEILPLLSDDATYSPAQSDAVKSVRHMLELKKVNNDIRGSRIRLKTQATLEEICRIVSQQTGNQIDVSELSSEMQSQPVQIDVHDALFWPVLDQICKQARVTYATEKKSQKSNAPEQQLKLYAVSDGSKAPLDVTYAGSTRASLVDCNLKPVIGNESRFLLRATWQVRCEPRLRVLFLSLSANKLLATTAQGKTLNNRNPAAKYELPFSNQNGNLAEFHVDYDIDAAELPVNVQFSGAMQILTAAGKEQFRFQNLHQRKVKTVRKGDVTISVLLLPPAPTDENEKPVRFQIDTVYKQGGPAFESYRSWFLQNPLHLETSDGQKIPSPVESQFSLQTGTGARLVYRFRNIEALLKDYRLVYTAPTVLIDIPVKLKTKPILVSLERNPQ